MLESVYPAWLAVESANRGVMYCYDWYKDELDLFYENNISRFNSQIAYNTQALEIGENSGNMTEDERSEYISRIEFYRKLVVQSKEEQKTAIANREKDLARDLAGWYLKKRFGYISTALLMIGAVAMVFGGISLAFSIGTGRKWTWINILLLPLMGGGGYAFMVLSENYPRFDGVIGGIVAVVFLIAVAIVLRRIVEWIAPVRDESSAGRDMLRRSHISRACIAVLVLNMPGHIVLWSACDTWLEDEILNQHLGIYSWAIILVPLGLIIASSILIGLRKARLTLFAMLILLIVLNISAFTLCIVVKIIPYYNYHIEIIQPIIIPLTAALLFLYLLIALAVMLIRPLGEALFEKKSITLVRLPSRFFNF
ncbi:MAG: hypothetical protein ACYS8W_07655 [Planctomycetota bacterium]